jgi:hypothetical protein
MQENEAVITAASSVSQPGISEEPLDPKELNMLRESRSIETDSHEYEDDEMA